MVGKLYFTLQVGDYEVWFLNNRNFCKPQVLVYFFLEIPPHSLYNTSSTDRRFVTFIDSKFVSILQRYQSHFRKTYPYLYSYFEALTKIVKGWRTDSFKRYFWKFNQWLWRFLELLGKYHRHFWVQVPQICIVQKFLLFNRHSL